MSRTEARELLMQAVFQMEAQKDKSVPTMNNLLRDKKISKKEREYITTTFETLNNHLEEIDALIDDNSPKWKVKRMPKADLAITRLAVCEAKFCEDIPAAVAINEGVNLAKAFGGDNTPAFVNGVLGKIING